MKTNNFDVIFSDLLKKIADEYSISVQEVFYDFLIISSEKLFHTLHGEYISEERCPVLAEKYDKFLGLEFVALLDCLRRALLSDQSNDFLGTMYHQLFNERERSRSITPFNVSMLLSSFTFDDTFEKEVLEKEFVTVNLQQAEMGGTAIALANHFRQKGHNPQNNLWIQCCEVDEIFAYACYLQLSLLNLNGQVVTKHNDKEIYLNTIGHCVGGWHEKLMNCPSE